MATVLSGFKSALACNAGQETYYFYQLYNELKMDTEIPYTIYIDNTGAALIAENDINNKRTRHINVKYHFIRDKIAEGIIDLKYIETKLNIADMFTKPLPNESFSCMRNKLMNITEEMLTENKTSVTDMIRRKKQINQRKTQGKTQGKTQSTTQDKIPSHEQVS